MADPRRPYMVSSHARDFTLAFVKPPALTPRLEHAALAAAEEVAREQEAACLARAEYWRELRMRAREQIEAILERYPELGEDSDGLSS